MRWVSILNKKYFCGKQFYSPELHLLKQWSIVHCVMSLSAQYYRSTSPRWLAISTITDLLTQTGQWLLCSYYIYRRRAALRNTCHIEICKIIDWIPKICWNGSAWFLLVIERLNCRLKGFGEWKNVIYHKEIAFPHDKRSFVLYACSELSWRIYLIFDIKQIRFHKFCIFLTRTFFSSILSSMWLEKLEFDLNIGIENH